MPIDLVVELELNILGAHVQQASEFISVETDIFLNVMKKLEKVIDSLARRHTREP